MKVRLPDGEHEVFGDGSEVCHQHSTGNRDQLILRGAADFQQVQVTRFVALAIASATWS
jgi:hypothetical protein